MITEVQIYEIFSIETFNIPGTQVCDSLTFPSEVIRISKLPTT